VACVLPGAVPNSALCFYLKGRKKRAIWLTLLCFFFERSGTAITAMINNSWYLSESLGPHIQLLHLASGSKAVQTIKEATIAGVQWH